MSADAARRPGAPPPELPPHSGSAGLISHLSHSLRTPLNSILGYAQILMLDRSEPLSAVQRERVERIQQAGWQLVKLLDEVAQRAAAEAGGAQPGAAEHRPASGEAQGRAGGERPPGSAA